MSAIPIYLAALYSINYTPSWEEKTGDDGKIKKELIRDYGTNKIIYSNLKSIMLQEMFHLAIACNLLISIGGVP